MSLYSLSSIVCQEYLDLASNVVDSLTLENRLKKQIGNNWIQYFHGSRSKFFIKAILSSRAIPSPIVIRIHKDTDPALI